MNFFKYFLFLLLCNFLFATTLARLDLTELYQKSDTIVRGKFQDSTSSFINGHIWTRWNFLVEEYVKGAGPSMIEILQPGGTYKNYVTHVSASRIFETNDHDCLFLFKNENHFEILGLSQGSLTLREDASGEVYVIPDESSYFLYPQAISRAKSKVIGSESAWSKFLRKGKWNDFVEVLRQNE